MEYPKPYTMLFNVVTDALAAMERQNYGAAREFLVNSQIACEAWFLSQEDGGDAPGVPQ